MTVIRYARKQRTHKRPWLPLLMERRPTKVAAVALANKIARTACAIMVRGGRTRLAAPMSGDRQAYFKNCMAKNGDVPVPASPKP